MKHDVYLFSNCANRYSQHDNSLFHFITEFDTPLDLSQGRWEVAILEVFYPKLLHNSSTTFFYIYSDISEHVFVGSNKYPVLRPILFKNQHTNYDVNWEIFKNPIYVPVNKEEINSIEILFDTDLENENYQNYALAPGDIKVHLQIRQVEEVLKDGRVSHRPN